VLLTCTLLLRNGLQEHYPTTKLLVFNVDSE